jgi:hypothetical protein
VCLFAPFKARCRASFNLWSSKHPGKAITIYDVAHLTASAFDEAFNRKNIISGFLKTGCYPFNTNIFSCEDFIGAQVTEVDDPSQHTILAATPEKNRLEEEQMEKERKQRLIEERKLRNIAKKKVATHVRKVFSEETSESEIENCCEESDDSPMEAEEDEESKNFEWIQTDTLKGDYVLVKFATKKTIKFFVGQIETKISESEFLVNFFKKTGPNVFVFPDQKDDSQISLSDIVRKLPAPEKNAETARSSLFFKFSINFDGYNMG